MNKIAGTGFKELDGIIQELRMGDNVVWQVENLECFRVFVNSFVNQNATKNKKIIYFRYSRHEPLINLNNENITVYKLDASSGFESFVNKIYKIIKSQGKEVFYVFDCLSDLLSAWATDLMIANFFEIICPYLYELDTIAYFALLFNKHSSDTIEHIRKITQVFFDLYLEGEDLYVHPVKVCGRFTSEMYLPHKKIKDKFISVTESINIIKQKEMNHEKNYDYWDKLFFEVNRLKEDKNGSWKIKNMIQNISKIMLSKDERLIKIVEKYFDLGDLLNIKSRLIGTGFIGGKSLGMLLARKILAENSNISIKKYMEKHDSFFVGSDVYYSYIVQNGWWKLWLEQKSQSNNIKLAEKLKNKMLEGSFPEQIKKQYQEMLNYFGQAPIVIRSSSLLEDSFQNSFAGKYESYFCVNQGTPEERYNKFEQIIRKVYASTFKKEAIIYRFQNKTKSNSEQMSILVQRVSGGHHKKYFFPFVSGVGFSYNVFSWNDNIDPETGMIRVVFGLGTRAVNRTGKDYPRMFAMGDKCLELYKDQESNKKYRQRKIDVLNLQTNNMETKTINKLMEENPDIENIKMIGKIETKLKTYQNWIINFEQLLKSTNFPEIINDIFCVLEKAYDYPVDIEFTVNINDSGQPILNLLQCRPLQIQTSGSRVHIPEDIDNKNIFFQNKGNFIGGNINLEITDIIYVVAREYLKLKLYEKYDIARKIGKLNNLIKKDKQKVALIGPGRWGTKMPQLGVPVNFSEINNISVLIEVAYLDYKIKPEISYGTHFFQDLIENNISYIALDPEEKNCYYNKNISNKKTNILVDLLPEAVKYQRVIKVYKYNNEKLKIRSDFTKNKVTGYIK